MTRRERWALAWAVLRGAEIVEHLTPRTYAELHSECNREQQERTDEYFPFWMVEPDPSVWVPVRFPCGKNDTRLRIAPVVLRGGRVTVIRW